MLFGLLFEWYEWKNIISRNVGPPIIEETGFVYQDKLLGLRLDNRLDKSQSNAFYLLFVGHSMVNYYSQAYLINK